jgi:hypothetical protein
MRRRHLLSFTAAGPLALLSACASAQPSYTVSLRQMQQALDGRFPRSYPVAGLLDLQLQTPRLALLPERNQINAMADVQASGPLLRRSHGGTFDVDFALRYEPSDRTLRAHDLRVNALRLDGLSRAGAGALRPAAGRPVAARGGAAPAAAQGPRPGRRPGRATREHHRHVPGPGRAFRQQAASLRNPVLIAASA